MLQCRTELFRYKNNNKYSFYTFALIIVENQIFRNKIY